MFWFFGLPPLAPNRPLPRAIFDGICDVLCTSSTPQKRAVFLPPGAGRRHTAPPPIAKAKATPHAMRSNMPGIRCLVHRRIFKTGWRLWPPTRASFPGRGQATHKKTHWKGNQNQPYLIQLGEGLPTVFPPSFFRVYCPVFLLPPTVSDTVGYTLCYAQLQQNYWHILPMRMVLAPQCCFQLPPSLTSLASFSFFPQPYQIQLAGQGGFEPLTSRHRHWIA